MKLYALKNTYGCKTSVTEYKYKKRAKNIF